VLFLWTGNGYACYMMKRTRIFHALLLAALLIAVPWSGSAIADEELLDSLAGSWTGSFQVGNYPPLELVFHLSRNEAGGLDARLDIPSQFRTGIPAELASLDGQRLTLRFPAIEAEFMGGLVVDGHDRHVERIHGDWGQSGEFVALTLRRQQPGE